MRPALYGALVGVLGDESQSNDLAVRLTALETLKSLVDDWSFDRRIFAPMLPRAVEALYQLLHAASEFESRLQILTLVRERASGRGCDDAATTCSTTRTCMPFTPYS